MITAEIARQLLTYDGEHLRWNVSRSGTARKGDIAGRIHSSGYRTLKINSKQYMVHRIIWLIVHGQFPTHSIDHIDQNKLNNRIENLRDVAQAINNKNRPLQKNNSSGRIGVYWRKDKQTWQAIIKHGQIQTHLGFFKNKDDAIAARQLAEQNMGFHSNHGQTPKKSSLQNFS